MTTNDKSMTLTYRIDCPVKYKIWVNNGGGYEKSHDCDDDDLPRSRQIEAQSGLKSALLDCGSFDEVASLHLHPSIFAGAMVVLDHANTTFFLDADHELSEAELAEVKSELIGQLSDGLYENIDGNYVVEWDGGHYKDYAASPYFDVENIGDLTFYERSNPKASPRLAKRFTEALNHKFGGLAGMLEANGPVLAEDLMYMQLVIAGGIQPGNFSPADRDVLEDVISKLPGANLYKAFLPEAKPQHKPGMKL